MNAKRFGFSCLIWGVMLGCPLAAFAQSSTTTWKDLIGTWEEDLKQRSGPPGAIDEPGAASISGVITFHPDSSFLVTDTYLPLDGQNHIYPLPDTLSRPDKRLVVVNADTIRVLNGSGPTEWTWWGAVVVVHVQDKKLSMKFLCHPDGQPDGPLRQCAARGFTRIDPSQRPFARAFATGLQSAHPIQAHPVTPTGTLADLVGAWEAVLPNTRLGGGDSLIRYIRIFQPDSTIVDVRIVKYGKDTLVIGYGGIFGGDWKGWKRQPGDTLLKEDKNIKIILKDQTLSYLWNGGMIERFRSITFPKWP